jgi:thymidine phosphorylase
MDVKAGSGAFMPTREDSVELGRSIAEVSTGAGVPCAALLTDMDQVLGHSAGNAVEVREAIDVLRDGTGDARLVEVTLELARAALELVGVDGQPEAALHSGAAAERFAHMVSELGGPADLLDAPERHLPEAPVRREVPGAGTVTAIDVRALGLVVMELGGGRRRETDDIDHAVGLTDVAGLGEDASRLATVHARDEQSAARAEDAVRAAVTTGDGPVTPPPLVERIGSR